MSPSDPLEQAADQAVAEEIGGLANGIQSPMTIHIPDWIFCGPFWAGFGSAILLVLIFIAWALPNMGPRF